MKIDLQRINRTVVNIDEEELIENFKASWQEVLMECDREDMPNLSKSYWEDCKNVYDRNYRKLFNDGMTMMLLGPDAFKAVDGYFQTKRVAQPQFAAEPFQMEIVVNINCENETITIEEHNLQY